MSRSYPQLRSVDCLAAIGGQNDTSHAEQNRIPIDHASNIHPFFYPPASSMVLSIGPKTLSAILLTRVANPLTIGEAPMVWLAISMMLVGTSMKFSRLENFIEVVFDRFRDAI